MGLTMTRSLVFAFACLLLSGCGLWIDNFTPGSDVGSMDAGPRLVDAREVGVDAAFDAGSCSVDSDCITLDSACTLGGCESGHCIARPLTGACDDGDSCTSGDVCSEGRCVSTPMDCSEFSTACTVGSCSAGICIVTPLVEGSDCDDTNLCSWADACEMNSCGGVTTDCGVRVDTRPTTSTATVGTFSPTTFEDRCPVGQVMTGIRASLTTGTFYDHLVRQYTTRCSVVQVSDTGALTMTPGDELPPGGRGGYMHGEGRLGVECPANHVVVGLNVDASTPLPTVASVNLYPSRLVLRCAPLSAVGSLATGFTASIGAVSMAEPTLGTRTSRSMASDCPAGSVATGSAGSFGDVIDAIGLLCGSIPLTVVTTAPPVGTPDASSVPFRDDCPFGHVPVGVSAAVTSVIDRPLAQFQTLCAPLAVTGSSGAWTASIGAARVPASPIPWGAEPGAVTTQNCPENQMIVGYQAAGSAAVSELALRCASITVTGPSITELTFGYEPPTTTLTIGLPGAAALSPIADCPSGTLGRGFYGNATALLNSVALRCSVPTFR